MKTALRFLLAAAVAWIGTWGFTSQAARAAEEAGRVLAVRNQVMLEREGQRSPAAAQSPLYLQDAVLTDAKSRTKLFFRDDSILNLGELSQVMVEEYLYNAEKDRSSSIYRLVEGSLKVVVGRTDLEIHTATAVAAARGTKFIVWIEGKPEAKWTGLLVLEGEVLVRSIQADLKQAQRVQAGEMIRVPAGAEPAPPSPIDPSVLKWYNLDTLALGTPFSSDSERLRLDGTAAPEGSYAQTIQDSLSSLQTPPIEQEPIGAFTPVNIHLDFPTEP
ncbi:MAG: FecR family protein [bacterium]